MKAGSDALRQGKPLSLVGRSPTVVRRGGVRPRNRIVIIRNGRIVRQSRAHVPLV